MYKNVDKEINGSQINNKNKIVTYKNLDIKNDIDNVAALIANLDIVISAQTWIGDFASALGTEVFKFHNIFSITRLGQKIYHGISQLYLLVKMVVGKKVLN